MKKPLFAVTDIETTGGHARGNAITEVAIVLTDGKQELDRFHSLIRPDQAIPYYITSLTGITNEMVADAPSFEDVAEELLSFYDDAIFVAHNVGFDYSFLKHAFGLTGRMLKRPKLCTVRLARKVYPGLSSYSLGNLCRHFGIENPDAHRALSDTLATVDLLRHCLESDAAKVHDMILRSSPEQWLPPALPPEEFEGLPETPGVYYFHGPGGALLYIGMSQNVKKRVRQHFGGSMTSARRQAFLKDICSISVEVTGSLAIARLLEDAEIRKHRPPHNRAQTRRVKGYHIISYTDREGYERLSISEKRISGGHVETEYSMSAAREWLYRFAHEYDLAAALCGLPALSDLLPERDQHNAKLRSAIDTYKHDDRLLVFRDRGRNARELSVLVVQGRNLVGYTYVDESESITDFSDLEDRLMPLPKSEMTASILRQELLSEGKMRPITIEGRQKKGPHIEGQLNFS